MPGMKQVIFTFVLVVALVSTIAAQESTTAQKSTLTITAAAAGERVRITAPASVVQMHVEVYAVSGERVFDQEIRGGNVVDWQLQDGQAQRLVPGSYVCVVTAKSVSGKLTQKLGIVRVEEKSVSVQPAELLSAPQAQTIGPVEENSSWTIPGRDELQTPTVIAHDGSDGQMIRGRGALTFRIGNFFSGFDQEQMRLTEAGNLGIGTSEPKAKLDVAGTIRAERFLIAKPNKTGSDKTAADSTAQPTDAADSVQPLVSGSGTAGKLTKWFDNSGALVDSIITESASGNVGIGTTSPAAALTIKTAINKELLVRPASDFGGLSTAVALHATNSAYNASIPLAIEATTLTLNAATGGNVGIGTTNPFLPFQVRPVAGTNFAVGDTTGGWGFPGSLLDSVNDSSSLIPMGFNASKFFFANGNVGIGTTAPGAKLDVAGDVNTSTQYNIGGSRVLSNSGTGNLFAGVTAGQNNTTGSFNSFFGTQAGQFNTGGFDNSFFGNQAGASNIMGEVNSFFGLLAGATNTTGGGNSFFGVEAGYHNIDGKLNTAIGFFADFGSSNLTNATAIGSQAQVNQSNSLVLGSIKGVNNASDDTKVGIGTTAPLATLHIVAPSNGDANNTADFQAPAIGPNHSHIHYGTKGDWYIRSAAGTESIFGPGKVVMQDTGGNVGIGTASPDHTLTVNGTADKTGGGSWDVFSDERLKNIKGRFTPGLRAVMQLQPVRYEYKPDNALGLRSSGEHIGFGAQAVQKIIPEAVTENDKGYLLVNNDPIMWTMLNAIKEQQKEVEVQQRTARQQQDQIAALRTQNTALNARLQMIERTLRNKRGLIDRRR